MKESINIIYLSPGETKTLELESRPSTGYEWILRSDKFRNITVEKKAFVQKAEMTGAAGMTVFEITALKKGSCLLHFELRRPWETEKLPAGTRSFRIIVK